MQRKKIEVGTEYLVSDRRDWQAYTNHGDRVVIVDTNPWQSERNWTNDPERDVKLLNGTVLPNVPAHFQRPTFARKNPDMLGRLVESRDSWNPAGTYVLVKPLHVKALWTEGRKLQTESAAERSAQQDESRIRREMREAHYADLSEQVTELFGFEPHGDREEVFYLTTAQVAEILYLVRNK